MKIILLLIIICSAFSEDLIIKHTEFVRAGLNYSVEIKQDTKDHPSICDVKISYEDDTPLLSQEIFINKESLKQGFTVLFQIPKKLKAKKIKVSAVTKDKWTIFSKDEKAATNMLRLANKITDLNLKINKKNALARLWLEQANLYLFRKRTILGCRLLQEKLKWLDENLAGKPQTSTDKAFIDNIDSGVVPYRLYKRNNEKALIVVLRAALPKQTKINWKEIPLEQINLINNNGIAILDVFSGGAIDANGIYLDRIKKAINIVLKENQQFDKNKIILWSTEKTAAAISVLLKENLFSSLLVSKDFTNSSKTKRAIKTNIPTAIMQDVAKPYDKPSAKEISFFDKIDTRSLSWLYSKNKAKQILKNETNSYFKKPFVVIIGTKENLLSVANNKRAALNFLTAWEAHAHSRPEYFFDKDFDSKKYKNHNWIIMGNSRSNIILQNLIEKGLELPVTWDTRSITEKDNSMLRNDLDYIIIKKEYKNKMVIIIDGKESAVKINGKLPLSEKFNLKIKHKGKTVIK